MDRAPAALRAGWARIALHACAAQRQHQETTLTLSMIRSCIGPSAAQSVVAWPLSACSDSRACSVHTAALASVGIAAGRAAGTVTPLI